MAPRVVWLERDSFPASVEVRRPTLPLDWVEYPSTRPEEAAARLAGAAVAIINKLPLRAPALKRLPSLRLISVSATGTDCVDLEACRRLGIAVANVRGYAAQAVAEHTFALMLAALRRLPAYTAAVADGRWSASSSFCWFGPEIRDLAGLQLGLVGRGAIGGTVARIAEAFGMEVLAAGRKGDRSPPAPLVPFDEMLARADVISLHCPLTPETVNLIGAPEFARMARRPLLVNTARGGLVDEAALLDALQRGLVSGAALDTVSAEPPPADHVAHLLAERPDVIVTPHVAWASTAAMQRLLDMALANVEAFLSGRPTSLVVEGTRP